MTATTRKPIFSSRASLATAWAVALGCTTAKRLAREWCVSRQQAQHRLRYACRFGLIERVGFGVYVSQVKDIA